MFNQMVADLTPRLKKTTTNCRKPLSVGLNLAITLRYLATSDSYKSLAYGFRVAPNTIVTPEVCQAIYDHYHETAFKCPTTEAEWKEVASGFSDKWNFLHCCGAISLVHVRNLHPGCKFAPGVYFWPCERCFKNLHPGATRMQICPCLRGGANLFSPGCTRVQIVHMNANCIISIHFDWRFRTMAGIFNYDVV